ncbi:MAG: hypothetical protein Q8L69_08955 [Gallionellaceae bacterium]|nr:hypothetical protein [Gallionellaceae bacterium]
MPVSPANLASNYVSQVQPQPQSHTERVVEKEKVEAAKQPEQKKPEPAAEAALKPTVNTEGQAVGNVINVKA